MLLMLPFPRNPKSHRSQKEPVVSPTVSFLEEFLFRISNDNKVFQGQSSNGHSQAATYWIDGEGNGSLETQYKVRQSLNSHDGVAIIAIIAIIIYLGHYEMHVHVRVPWAMLSL
jgi:hypothetical protein